MNHHAAFFNTAAENPPKILHLQLRPLTLGHVYLLHCVESPFVMPEKEMDVSDFFLATFICSEDWRKSKRNLTSRFFPVFLKFWAWNTKRRDYSSHLARFDEYMATGMKSPDQKLDLKPGDSMETPWLWRLASFLLCEASIGLDEIFDLQVWQANAIYVARSEMKYGLKLVSERDGDLWEYAAREDAKLFGGNN